MSSPRYDSVEDYLASLPSTKAQTLRSVLDFVLREFPDLEARVAWNVPQIHRDGDYVFGVSSAKTHLAVAPWSSKIVEHFTSRLERDGYVVRKNLFQVPDDWEMDQALVKDLVQTRLAELDAASR